MDSTQNSSGPEARQYLVGWVDVLGQSDELKKLGGQKTSDGELRAQLLRTVGRVQSTRTLIRRMLNSQCKELLEHPMLGADPKLQGMSAGEKLRVLGIEGGVIFLSDAFLFYAPLERADGQVSTNVRLVLDSVSALMIFSMAEGVPLRGGLEIGLAATMAEGDLYGYPCFRAFQLEATVAEYPRIVVGEKLMDYLQVPPSAKAGPIEDWPLERRRFFARWMQPLLLKDPDDGSVTLDYLGEFLRKNVLGGPQEKEWRKAVGKGMAFIRNKHRQLLEGTDCQDLSEEKRRKLALKYSRLKRYWRSRVPHWQRRSRGGDAGSHRHSIS